MGKALEVIGLVLVCLYLLYMAKWYMEIMIQDEVKMQLNLAHIKKPSVKEKDNKDNSTKNKQT